MDTPSLRSKGKWHSKSKGISSVSHSVVIDLQTTNVHSFFLMQGV